MGIVRLINPDNILPQVLMLGFENRFIDLHGFGRSATILTVFFDSRANRR